MKLVLGLGNHGEKYKKTRHNVGFMVVDELVRQMVNEEWLMDKKFNSLLIKHQPSIIFSKPQTFMNDSGRAVASLASFYKLPAADIWVIHDDLDLRLGEYKIQLGVGPKLHYGISSVEEKLGKKDFWRVRIGVDNRTNDGEQRTRGEEYVLQDFSEKEIEIRDGVIGKVVEELRVRFKT